MTQHPRRTRGFSLVECVVACAIAGGLLVAALSAAGATAKARARVEDRELGLRLARDLLAEIVAKQYIDADDEGKLGPEAAEVSLRTNFDDVDDYQGYKDSGAKTPDGENATAQTGWTRTVEVRWAMNKDLDLDASEDEGIKRVTVRAERADGLAITLVAYRTAQWDAVLETK